MEHAKESVVGKGHETMDVTRDEMGEYENYTSRRGNETKDDEFMVDKLGWASVCLLSCVFVKNSKRRPRVQRRPSERLESTGTTLGRRPERHGSRLRSMKDMWYRRRERGCR